VPRADSKSAPEAKMVFISAFLFSELYWARYFIMAELVPQSLKRPMKAGDTRAIVYSPYWDGPRSLTTSIVPIADMRVERVTPRNKLKPLLAESFAILTALFIKLFP